MKKGILLAIFAVFMSGIALASQPEGHGSDENHHATEATEAAHSSHTDHATEAKEAHGDEAHADEHGGHAKEPFDAGAMIMHHISDAHQIHIATLNEGKDNEKHISIPLPIIIWDGGLKVFSSSKFYHHVNHNYHIPGGHVYEYGDYFLVYADGEKIYKSENGKLNFDENQAIVNASPLDLSITKSIMGLIIALILTFFIFRSIAKGYKRNGNSAPKGMAAVFEPLILFVRDEVAVPSIGKRANQFMPFLLTIFFFIWIANLMGLVPGFGFNVMGTMGVTVVLAGIVFIISTAKSNKHFWKHTLNPDGVPLPIKFILVPIEIAGMFIRPAVLMVRLTANITAGHIIILAFTALIFIFGETSATAGWGVGVGSVLFMIFMFFIELLVAFLQAYVFTLLSAIYFGMAVEEAHH